MKTDNVLKDKSLKFGIRIVKLSKHFIGQTTIAEHPLFTQILKSGTSIGANVRESEFGESKDDFKHKLKIALKEANETEYWIEILHEGEYLNDSQYDSIIVDCRELIKLLTASVNTLNNK
ncbi:MAG: four helix bundle protein [Salinivirgaceae bacterium]|nr:four helix bundle protein [Salinivirgaceae bacterium]